MYPPRIPKAGVLVGGTRALAFSGVGVFVLRRVPHAEGWNVLSSNSHGDMGLHLGFWEKFAVSPVIHTHGFEKDFMLQ